MDVVFARQPIFDRTDRVVGYELLHRSGDGNAFSRLDGRTATAQLLSDSLLGDDWKRITSGVPAWINFPRDLLLDESATLVPAEHIVVEILEDVAGDDEVVEACSSLRARGYVLAADDVIDPGDDNPLLELVDIVKVDFRTTDASTRRMLAERFPGKRLLAEKVETVEERCAALELGYGMLQGYYLHRPTVVQNRAIDRSRMGLLGVLAALAEDPMDWDSVERALRSEVALTDKLLRYLNSAAFAWRRPVESLRAALVMLGERQIRRWLGVMALSTLSADRPTELLTSTLLRAHMCEALSPLLSHRATSLELYTAGLYSLMHLLLSAEPEATLRQAPLADEVRGALLDRCGLLWDAVQLCESFERADWQTVTDYARRLQIDETQLAGCYDAALTAVEAIHELSPKR